MKRHRIEIRHRMPSLRQQLVLIFLAVAIPLAVLLSVLQYLSALSARDRMSASAASNLELFTSTLANQMASTESYLLNTSQNNARFRSLSEADDRTQCYLDLYEIMQGFPSVLATNDSLMAVFLYSGTNNLSVGRYNTVEGTSAERVSRKLELESYLTDFRLRSSRAQTNWYLRTVGDSLYLMRTVEYRNAALTAVIDVEQVFSSLLKSYGLDGETFVYSGDSLLIGDADACPQQLEWNEKGYCMVKRGRRQYIAVQCEIQTLTVLYLTPYQRISTGYTTYEILLTVALVFSALSIPFLIFYLKHEIIMPMGRLVATMDRIGSGELTARPDIDYRNAEFTRVNETFNRMIDQITQLKIDSYEKELEARRNEMTALKLQIRPHFVLNCLKSVYAMVQTGSAEDAQQLILLLSRYLRYILSFNQTTTSLQTEVEQCANYASLSSVGQAEPVELVCEIDPAMSDLPIPPVSLLTLVENSIKHGKVIGRPLRLFITAKLLQTEQSRVANITVSDTGGGFSPEDLKQLNSAMPQEENGHHVGLHNVIRRLQLLYGEQTAVAFANRRGGGARVELFLPLDADKTGQDEG